MPAELTEHDLEYEGVPVHCWEGGTGICVVFLHGSGAGAATLSNFRRVLGPLTEDFHVLAADLIGFGQSGLRKTSPYFDMGLWIGQLRMLLDYLASKQAIVVGHSLSGAIALKAAAVDERIAGVITTATMGTAPKRLEGDPRWRFPENPGQVREAVERTFYNKAFAEEAEVERRLLTLSRPGYRKYFEAMFAGPSSEYMQASSLSISELASIHCPVIFMHGANDASFRPEETSLTLAEQLPQADVYILSRCAHSVAHERPREFLATVRTLAGRITDQEGRPS
jgi:2-hydroxymuconate-semialdehyde hydrolase